MDDYGEPKRLGANVALVLHAHPGWAGKLAFDEFAETIILREPTPAHEGPPHESYPRPWRDDDAIRTAHWLQRDVGLEVTETLVANAVIVVSRQNPFHPVRDYLRSLQWDGIPRIDTWLTTYAGAQQSGFNSKAGARFLIQAVARIMKPGCKADCVLVLEGGQGGKKSTLGAILGGGWFTDELADLDSKDAAIGLRGKWIIEVAELDAFRGKAGSRIKAFVSRSVDHYRAPYDRIAIDRPRQSVFLGTTNKDTYLQDETGARRFWPVKAKSLDEDALRRDRDQLWAEAVVRYDRGERWWFEREELPEAEAAQAERYERDEWETRIEKFLKDKTRTTVTEVMKRALDLIARDESPSRQKRVVACLTRLGWIRRREPQEDAYGRREWFYSRPEPAPVSGETPVRPTPSQSTEVSGTAESSTGTRVVPVSQSVPLELEDFAGGNEQGPRGYSPIPPRGEYGPETGTKWDSGTPLAGQGEPASHSEDPSQDDEVLV